MRILILTLLIILSNIIYSQEFNNYWHFGDSAGLHFTSGSPEYILNSSLQSHEPSASISDSSGNLLFYSNSIKVWDKNNNIMPNGNDLAANINVYGSSITQGCLIIPTPEQDNLFYLFTLDFYYLYYSAIDMNLNSGLGDVTAEKNIQLSEDEMTEKLNAVKHANGRDWWVITHSSLGNTYYKYLVTPDGVEGPFLQTIGAENLTTTGRFGEMIFTEQGDKLISVYNVEIIDLFDFDRCTGELSNWIDLRNDAPTPLYGASFSPDGCKLYISEYPPGKLFQYDICQGDIKASKTLIFDNPLDDFWMGQHQLAPDGKIYICMSYDILPNEVFDFPNENLSVINNPNAEGMACDFDTATIWLGGKRSIFGLPNFPNYNLGALAGSECDTLSTALHTINKKDAISIYPNPSSTSFIISGNVSFGDEVVMYNATGQLLLQEKIIANQSIDISGIPSGIYLVQLKNNEVIKYTEKFIKVEGNNKK